jgi:hypothetical protein
MRNFEQQEISQENTLYHKEMEINYLKEKNKELLDEINNKDLIISDIAECFYKSMTAKQIDDKFCAKILCKNCVGNCVNCIINHFSLKK